jgi:signal transduction histidine kinase
MSTVLTRAAQPLRWLPIGGLLNRPPARWILALLLVLGVVWGAAVLRAHGARSPAMPDTRPVATVTDALGVAMAPSAPTHRLPPAALTLLSLMAAAGVVGLMLSVTQRGWSDVALAGAGLLGAVHTALDARAALALRPAAPTLVMQALAAVALLLLAWYGVQLHQRFARHRQGLPWRQSLLLGTGLTLALTLAGWLSDPLWVWLLPLCGLSLGACCLVQATGTVWRYQLTRSRPVGGWLQVACIAAILGCAVNEWLARQLWPAGSEPRVQAWYATRWAVLALLGTYCAMRMAQLSGMLRQLGRSHRSWRSRLKAAQREVAELRDRLALLERTDSQRRQRDRILRELHDEIGHRWVGLQARVAELPDAAEDRRLVATSLLELQMACDALEPVPRPLSDALATLKEQLQPALAEADVRLTWTVQARAALLVLPTAQTLQLLRIVREALDQAQPASRLVQGPGEATLVLEVLDGETGRHLHLRIGAAAGAGSLRAPGAAWVRLQRQATMLGAQLVIEGRPGAARSLELVMPLSAR